MIFKDKKLVLAFLLPALSLILIFLYYPFFQNILNSFQRIRTWGQSGEFIGLEHYKAMFQDPSVRVALKNTLYFLVITVVFEAGLGLILALLVDHIKRGRKFFQTVFFFPIVISATAVGVLFQLVFAYHGGILNNFMELLHLDPVNWLAENSALVSVSIPIVWQYVGLYFVILLTAINRIPAEMHECAQLEGANLFQRTFYIIIPMIWDVIKVVLLMAITGSLKIFEMIWIITGGGPKNTTHTLGTYLYKVTFESQKIGYGSALSVLLVVVGLVAALISNRLSKRESISY